MTSGPAQQRAVRRPLVVLVLISLVTGACAPASPSATIPASGAPPGSEGAAPSTEGTPQPGGGSGAGFAPLPADIVGAVDAIATAASDEGRLAATRAVLESIGIVVSGDADAAADSAAGLVLAPEEVELIAADAAQSDAYRVTLVEFATTFGGMALLPPNDGLAASLPNDWLEVPLPDAAGQASVDTSAYPSRFASVLSTWVTEAIANHAAPDPELVALTNAPLLLAELARRQSEPLDISQTFAPGHLRLGWLEITILIGGIRSMLAAAEASGIAGLPDQGAPVAGLAMSREDPIGFSPPQAVDAPCDALKQMLNSRVPLASTVISGFVGDQVKGFIQNFVNELFGEASAFAQNVSRAFKILGVLARVQALIMIYSEARATVEMNPAFYHKPDGGVLTAGATVTAGIPDGAWAAAQQARQLSPFATARRTCANFIGLPVFQDLVDIGDAVDGWKVQWRVSRGGSHIQIPGDQFLGPGAVASRLERPLSRVNDHTANDILGYEVLPERREDHPGTEVNEQVELCAHVFPKEPPGGVGTILSAGAAGSSLAGGAYLGLVAVIAKLLTSWISSVSPITGCGQANVSYHIPMPGIWHGTITANTERQESVTGTITRVECASCGTTVTNTSQRASVDVTDRFYVSGDEDQPGSGIISLPARVYVNGAAVFEESSVTSNGWTALCNYDKTETGSGNGGWSGEAGARVTLYLNSDGRYSISVSSDYNEEVSLDGHRDISLSLHSDRCIDNQSGTYPESFFVAPNSAGVSGATIAGQLDPANPGNRLVGSTSFISSYGWVTTITWNLTRDGPIQLPKQSSGGA